MLTQQRLREIRQEIAERNAQFFDAEAKKRDGWAENLKREIKETG